MAHPPDAVAGLAAMAIDPPVSFVASIRRDIENAEAKINTYLELIAATQASIANKRLVIQKMNDICSAAFDKFRSLDLYLSAVRASSLEADVSFDPVNAKAMFALYLQRPRVMPSSVELTAFAIRPDTNVVLTSESSGPVTIFSIPTQHGEDSITFDGVNAPDSTFHASPNAIYAFGRHGLVFSRFSDGITHKIECTTAAFTDDAVYYADGGKIYVHNIDADDAIVFHDLINIKAFAVYGDKIAVLFNNKCAALYKMLPGEVTVLTPPFQVSNIISVGVCNNLLVTAARTSVTVYDDTAATYQLPKGNDRPIIVNGPRCIVQSSQANLYEFKQNATLNLSHSASRTVCYKGLNYYINGRFRGPLKLADFHYLP